MGFLSKIFGTNDQESKKATKKYVDKLVERHAPTGDFERLNLELDKLDVDNLMIVDQVDWYFYKGISLKNLEQGDEAFKIFLEGIEKFPMAEKLAFCVGQEYEHIDDINKAKEYFKKVSYSSQTTDFANRIIQYYYLRNEYQSGIELVQSMLDELYRQSTIDDTFLHIRGIPFFSQIYPVKIVFSYLQHGSLDMEDFLKFKRKFGEEVGNTEDLIIALNDNSFDFIIESTTNILESNKKEGFPTAYQELQIAIFQNKTESNLSTGLENIDGSIVTENDFPWLNDLKLIAKAELCNRLNEVEMEKKFTKIFLERQILLFEPFIAFDFGLVNYQETLKTVCNENRKSINY